MHDVSFVPAYKDGSLPPFGQWAVDSLETKTDWYQWGNWNGAWLAIRRDMGGAFLKLNNSGQKISDVVGWLGFEWNQPREQYWNFFGYPGQSSPPFPPTASRMFLCTGNYEYSVNKGAFWLGPEMSAMGCDMGDGSSGGPWISDVSPIAGASNYLGGNMSIKRDGYPLEAISPYFDDAAISLWTCLVEGQGC